MINDQKIFTCGKYVGSSIASLKQSNYDYLMWLKEQEWISKHELLYNELKDLEPKPITMPWGRFKGRSIEFIWLTEPAYFGWLRDNDIIKKNKKVWAEICKYN
jgi:uncharacterized protein (DUF3820 family)